MDAAMDKERQVMEETHTERETRSAGDFMKMEELLPTHIGSRWNISFLDNMGSFLSTLNPMAKAVNPEKEEVWLLDNTAYRPVHIYPHQPQPFQAHFTAAYFKRYTGKDWSKAVASIADTLGLAEGEGRAQAEKAIAHRLKPFVETIAPARFVNIQLPDGTVEKLGPGGRSAVSQQTIISIQDHKDGDSAEIPATNPEVTPHGPMLTHFAEPEGWLMVSGTSHLPCLCVHILTLDRHRRLNQNNYDPFSDRHPSQQLRLQPYSHRWYARTLRPNRHLPQPDLVLSLRLPLQPLPLPSPIPPPILPQRYYHTPRRILDGSRRFPGFSHARNRNLQADSHRGDSYVVA